MSKIAELITEIKKESVATALGENYATIVQSLNEIDRDFKVAEKSVGKAESEAIKRKERVRELEEENSKLSEKQSTLESTISQLTSDKETVQKSLEDFQAKFNTYNEKNKKEWESVMSEYKIKENEKISSFYDFENDTPEAIEKNLDEFRKQKTLGIFDSSPPPATPPSGGLPQGDKPMTFADVMKKQVEASRRKT